MRLFRNLGCLIFLIAIGLIVAAVGLILFSLFIDFWFWWLI